MRSLFAPVLALSLALPVAGLAQEDDAPDAGQGAREFLEGLLNEMEPALEDLQGLAEDFGPALRDFAQAMGPALGRILEQVEDWSRYEAPVILPNGDILIRRKPDVPDLPEAPEDAPRDRSSNEPIDL
jgi:hypothetical protein